MRVYRATARFPTEELYGLMNQTRLCCVSIPVNITRGYAADNPVDSARTLENAIVGALELEYLLLLEGDLNLLDETECEALRNEAHEIRKTLARRVRDLRTKRSAALRANLTTHGESTPSRGRHTDQ
jgi:four helix bundle protein